MRANILLVILLFSFFVSFSQNKDVPRNALKHFNAGKSYFTNSDFQTALISFDKAISKYPAYSEAKKFKAFCYQNLDEFEKADQVYDQLLSDDPLNKSLLFQRAILYRQWKKFDLAIHFLRQYLTLEKSEKRKNEAEKLIANYTFILGAAQNPLDFNPIPFPDIINSNESEYLPSITHDGSILFFTRRTNMQEDLYYSRYKDDEWTKPIALSELNTMGNEGAFCIHPDGKSIIFTACGRRDSYGGCDLYISHFRQGNWTKPRNMGPEINGPGRDFQPSLTADGQILYFSSNRKGGFGKTDIWLSYRTKNNKWSPPVNAGPSINTIQEDESPFIHPDNRTLYFMSKGHPGMGDFDLFMCSMDEFGTWSNVKNLGYPINSPGNEGALFVDSKGETAYYSSDRKYFPDPFAYRKKSDFGDLDIYSFKLDSSLRAKPTQIVFGRVVNALDSLALQAEIAIFSPEFPDDQIKMLSGLDGTFSFSISEGRNYGLIASKKGYDLFSEHYTFEKTLNKEENSVVIALYPLKNLAQTQKSKPIVLNNVFFNSGQSDLLPSSFPELKKLVQYLQTEPNVRISIHGYTDNIGDQLSNQKLSEDRARSVYRFLEVEGIPKDRLTYKGHGEKDPLADNNTEEGRRQNRRVAFVILVN